MKLAPDVVTGQTGDRRGGRSHDVLLKLLRLDDDDDKLTRREAAVLAVYLCVCARARVCVCGIRPHPSTRPSVSWCGNVT